MPEATRAAPGSFRKSTRDPSGCFGPYACVDPVASLQVGVGQSALALAITCSDVMQYRGPPFMRAFIAM